MNKVIIVGGGPAGIFAALELSKYPVKVTLVDKSPTLGGSGLRSDGKLIFAHKDVGIADLPFLKKRYLKNIVEEIRTIFYNLGAKFLSKRATNSLKTLLVEKGINLHIFEEARFGSDILPEKIQLLEKQLRSSGVNIQTNTKVLNFDFEKVYATSGTFDFDYLLLATGRTGTLQLRNILDNLGIEYSFSPIDIGFRLEFPSECYDILVQDYGIWDFKASGFLNDQKWRTFCCCHKGFVIQESYGFFYNRELIGVNGHSALRTKSSNSNMALLATVHLTEPFEDTSLFGQLTAYRTNLLGGGRPLVQRLIDFKRHRRSKKSTINNCKITRTLKNSTPGDIRYAYDARTLEILEEGLNKMQDFLRFFDSETYLYAPEIKFYARKIDISPNFKAKNNIFVAGDGSGYSRSIVGAAITGILAARGILEEMM